MVVAPWSGADKEAIPPSGTNATGQLCVPTVTYGYLRLDDSCDTPTLLSFPVSPRAVPCLQDMHDRGLLIAISNDSADQEYMRLGAGIDIVCIPSN